jgi:paraquat-inducible protein B
VSKEPDRQDVPHAEEKRSRWFGWIWGVPIAALFVVGYLVLRQFNQQGPSLVVTFEGAGGVQADNTKVQYEGLEVGKVESVKLQKDMRHVDVSLQMNSDMEGHLGPGTRFWIAGTKPNIKDLSSLKTVISGPHIGVEPHPGKTQDHYQGLAEPPAVKEEVAGTHYTLTAATLGAISRDTTVYYRDLDVGTVEKTELEPDGKQFTMLVFVRRPFDRLVHANTHFWSAGAIQVSMAGAGPRVQFQSVGALFSGAVAFETPEDDASGVAKEGARFTLYDSRTAAENAPGAEAVRYHVTFSASDAGGLQSGAPVNLANRPVGSVQDSTLQYDFRSGELAAQVTLAIEPSRIHLANGETWQSDPHPQMDALMRQLIDQGLRARIGKTVPLVGGDTVNLDFVPQSTPASLGSGPVPELPTAPASDISGMLASVSGFVGKLNAMPLDQIADNVHDATQRLAALSRSPELHSTLVHLDQSVANIDAVTRSARGDIGPILARLRAVANEAQSAMASAKSLLASNGHVQNQPETTGIGNAMYELSRAAQSLRSLADYLDRHPEALLRGKG